MSPRERAEYALIALSALVLLAILGATHLVEA